MMHLDMGQVFPYGYICNTLFSVPICSIRHKVVLPWPSLCIQTVICSHLRSLLRALLQ